MNPFFPCGRRLAILSAALLFSLWPATGQAQQITTPTNEKVENLEKPVPGLASFASATSLADRQEPPPAQSPRKKKTGVPSSFGQFFKNIAHDQAGIWSSPLRIRRHDAVWLIPFAGATAAAIATDARALHAIDPKELYVRAMRDFTITGSPYTLLGAAGATYLLGKATHSDRLKETGALGSEAILNSILVVGALKLATNRERPDQGTGQGRFWPHGTRDFPYGTAFPSGHAAASWAFARVIAGEYPDKTLVKVLGYSWAALVSVSRVTGRKHYPSDALVGSVVGYLIGEYVVRHHASDRQHDTSLTISPFADSRTRSHGVMVTFSPALFRSGRLPN